MPELFKGGFLHMATDPLAQSGAPQLWADCTVNRWAVVVALILLIIELSEILRIYPHLLRCLSRWKGNADLEHSVSLARTRNTVAFVFGIIFCLATISKCAKQTEPLDDQVIYEDTIVVY